MVYMSLPAWLLMGFCCACSKKEVAWNAAMRAGEGADKQSDRGYLDATKAVGVPFFLDQPSTLTPSPIVC